MKKVLIKKPSKTNMQSGYKKTKTWTIEFDFDDSLQKDEGNFFLGDQVFYCDFNVYHHLSLALLLEKTILDNYPKLKKFIIDFEGLEGIKSYLDSRAELNGIGTWPKFIIDGKEYTSGTNPSYKYL